MKELGRYALRFKRITARVVACDCCGFEKIGLKIRRWRRWPSCGFKSSTSNVCCFDIKRGSMLVFCERPDKELS